MTGSKSTVITGSSTSAGKAQGTRSRKEDRMPPEQGDAIRLLQAVIDDFLGDLAQANRPRHTQRAYASDLHQFAQWHPGSLTTISAQCLREFFASLAHLSVGTRARKQA